MSYGRHHIPKCNAWDVSALLTFGDMHTRVQPGGDTWESFLDSLHHFVISLLREARRQANIIPYRAIPHPRPSELLRYTIAMKSQYTLQSRWCRVRVGFGSRGLTVYATDALEEGDVVTTYPVDALFLKHRGGVMLTRDNAPVEPCTVILLNTRHEDIYIASSRLYFCPERCGHVMRYARDANACIEDVFEGVMYVIRMTRSVSAGEEVLLPFE